MSIELTTKYGQIDISNEVIATIAGGAAVDCYGIVGMASKNQIKDGLTDILRKENFTRGVIVRQEEDLYILICISLLVTEQRFLRLPIMSNQKLNILWTKQLDLPLTQ